MAQVREAGPGDREGLYEGQEVGWRQTKALGAGRGSGLCGRGTAGSGHRADGAASGDRPAPHMSLGTRPAASMPRACVASFVFTPRLRRRRLEFAE